MLLHENDYDGKSRHLFGDDKEREAKKGFVLLFGVFILMKRIS